MVPLNCRRSTQFGFTVTELLVTVVILGVLAGLSIDAGLREWRREQVNAVAIELSGWLEQVRRSALRGQSCTVSVNSPTALTELRPSDQLASSTPLANTTTALTDPNRCLSNAPLNVPGNTTNSRFTVSSRSFTFTPRGSVVMSNNPTNIIIGLVGTDATRCVRISDILGVIDISKTANCADQERF